MSAKSAAHILWGMSRAIKQGHIMQMLTFAPAWKAVVTAAMDNAMANGMAWPFKQCANVLPSLYCATGGK